jgi:hypothetical protein
MCAPPPTVCWLGDPWVLHWQATSVINDPTSLLGTAYATGPSQDTWLGARRTVSSATAVGFVWVDGTPSAALNCGTQGCGPWATVIPQPEYVGLSFYL